MLIEKSSTTSGSWLDKKTLIKGDYIKIVSEAQEQPNPQGDGVQLVCKVLVKGKSKQPENLGINVPSKNALIDAFGKDTTLWVDKVVSIDCFPTIVGGKKGIALYLIPDGMVLKENNDGYVYVGHIDGPSGQIKNTEEIKQPVGFEGKGYDYPEEEINPGDIPF